MKVCVIVCALPAASPTVIASAWRPTVSVEVWNGSG